jgi:hypothetical protein
MVEILKSGKTPEFEEPVWWGLTVGSLAYAVKARNSQGAIDRVASSLGRTGEDMVVVPTFTHPNEDSVQPLLDERYPDRDLVRVVPFSIDEHPVQ